MSWSTELVFKLYELRPCCSYLVILKMGFRHRRLMLLDGLHGSLVDRPEPTRERRSEYELALLSSLSQ